MPTSSSAQYQLLSTNPNIVYDPSPPCRFYLLAFNDDSGTINTTPIDTYAPDTMQFNLNIMSLIAYLSASSSPTKLLFQSIIPHHHGVLTPQAAEI